MLNRQTDLNDPEMDIGGNENFFQAALQQINAGAGSASGHAVVIPTSQAPETAPKIGNADPPPEESSGEDIFCACHFVCFWQGGCKGGFAVQHTLL